jgi:hypothetical protein
MPICHKGLSSSGFFGRLLWAQDIDPVVQRLDGTE